MANNLSVTIGANTADLEKNINKAKNTLQEYRAAAKQAKNDIEANVGATTKQINAYDNVIKKLEKVTFGTLSCKQEQKVLTDSVRELKIQWNSLTDDQRISGWGQQVASSLKAAESELETVKGKLAAVSDETKKTSKGIGTVGTSSSKTGNLLGSLNGVLGKVGLAFGAAEVATTLFNGALKQSDEFGDLVTNKMAGLTNVVNSLGAALATLDFSGVMNFYSWFSSGQAASMAHDTLDDTEQQLQYVYKQAQEAVAKARETGSESDKANANKKIQELKTLTKQYRNNAIDAAAADLGKALNSDKLNGALSYEIIDAAIRATPKQQDNAKKTFKQQYAKLQAKALSASGEARWGTKSDALLKRYAKQGGLLNIMIGALWGTGSENRQQVIDDISKADDASRMASRLSKQLNSISDVNTPTVKAPTVKAPKVSTVSAPEEKTLLQIYEERIKKQEEELDYRQKNYEKLNEHVLKQRELNDEIEKQKELENIDWSKALPKDTKPVSLLGDIGKEIKDVDKLSKAISKKVQPDIDKTIKQNKELEKSEEDKNKKKEEGIKGIMGSTAAMMAQSSQLVGQETAAGQVLMTISKMVIIAKEAEAIAKGVAAATSAGWPACIPAIASIVASITSIFASLPTFADGGIIQGASKIGDYNVARVNDGEMILNGSQQARLFSMLNDNNTKLPNIQYMQPEVRIKGADIYLSQKNYKNISGRKL